MSREEHTSRLLFSNCHISMDRFLLQFRKNDDGEQHEIKNEYYIISHHSI